MFSHVPLWKTMEQKGITQYQLIKDFHFSTGTLDALRKNKSITINTRECQRTKRGMKQSAFP